MEDKKEKYTEFIEEQLSEMVQKIKQNLSENLKKRENNVFAIFSNEEVNKYMAMSRSFDSQLGTRLQKIAFFVSRNKYGMENIPNIIVLSPKKNDNGKDSIHVYLASCSHEYNMNQKVFWKSIENKKFLPKNINKLKEQKPLDIKENCFEIEVDKDTIRKIEEEFKKRDKKGKGIPIDLFILENKTKNGNKEYIAYSYEIKLGGNLDTKNAPSNAKEVRSLQTIFSFFDKSISRFATCYDGKGNGEADGAIRDNLGQDEIILGEKFWNEILEEDITYEEFINIYKNAYKKANVEENLFGKSKFV